MILVCPMRSSYYVGLLVLFSASANGDELKHPDWHPNGKHLIAEGSCNGNIALYLIEVESREVRLVFDSANVDGYPRWFADGERIAFHQIDLDRTARLYVANIAPGGSIADVRPVTTGPFDIEPAPSPDGTRLAFSRAGDRGQDIAVIDLQTGDVAAWSTPEAENLPSWHPDGDSILFHARDGDETQILLRSLATGEVTPLTQSGSPNLVGHLDSQGARLAFSSERDGDREIYLKDLHDGSETRITKRAGRDGYPSFSPSGMYITYHQATADGDTVIRILDLESGKAREISCNDMNQGFAKTHGGQPTNRHLLTVRTAAASKARE